ncbi:SWAHB protein, partial [Asarcornis scutulata]|nr:SWAHB protein [Asarcornis scutulata]
APRRAAPSPGSRAARMARELSQEAVLDFLWGAGGRAPNAALLRHFQAFLRDPALTAEQRGERRERFKRLVNSVATVRPAGPGASKDIVLRRRYRDLLDEELPPPGEHRPQEEEEEEEEEEEKQQRPPPPPCQPGPVPPPSRPPQARTPQPPRQEPPLSQSPLCRSAPGTLPLSQSQSLQTLTAERCPPQTPLLSPCPDALPSTRLPPSQSRSLQHLPTRPSPSPSPSPPRLEGLMVPPHGPARSRAPLLHTPSLPSPLTPPPPASPTVLPPCSQSPPLTPTGPPQAPESGPTAPLPVFRSIRCQLALLEVQGVPPSLQDDRGGLPRSLPSKSSPVHVPNRGLAVPLGRREHAWLVAVSAGRWAQVRGLFLEEPELALQRDFVTGFTVLHWLAKHGDGPGLQELAGAARQAGLSLDVDVRSGCGYTPLHLAAIHGHQLVIKVLVLQLGCQVQVRDGSGRRPWEYLGSNTSGEIWQLLQAP